MAEINPSQNEKDVVLGEKVDKIGVDVAVVESRQSTQISSRERVARYTKSIFTKEAFTNAGSIFWKFARFAGPGAVISVAYVDPDNLQSNVTAGAQFQFKLLFMILFANVVAVFLQVSTENIQNVTRQSKQYLTASRRCQRSWAVSREWTWLR
jgi:metal iron transporter